MQAQKKRKVDSSLCRQGFEEARATAEVPMIGKLRRTRGVTVSLFGEPLGDCAADEIVHVHERASKGVGLDDDVVHIASTAAVLRSLCALDLEPIDVDLGRTVLHLGDAQVSALPELLAGHVSKPAAGPFPAPCDCVLYGFGRIGRVLCRLLVAGSGVPGLLLRAIVVRPGSAKDLHKRASLLAYDSVHGKFKGTIEVDEAQHTLVVNGFPVKVIYSTSPAEVDYTSYGITGALIVDNTGIWRDKDGLAMHLKSKGAAKVLLTTPGSGVPNIVAGVNNHMVNAETNMYSAASCTTNAITPVLKAIIDQYGLESGHIETVHSYTNDQNLVDNQHKKDRRGRAAATNMVITETGAGKAVSKAIPEVAGKMTSNAVRVPTPNVSLAILILNLGRAVTEDEVNQFLQGTSQASPLMQQVGWTKEKDAVSSDFVGDCHAGTVDAGATMTMGNKCNLYVWYDNEWGYSCQVVRVMSTIAEAELPKFPALQ